MRPRLPLLLALACLHEAAGLCHNSCAGHGKCELRDTCLCHKRREQEYDDNLEVPAWTGADCSLRTFWGNPAPRAPRPLALGYTRTSRSRIGS